APPPVLPQRGVVFATGHGRVLEEPSQQDERLDVLVAEQALVLRWVGKAERPPEALGNALVETRPAARLGEGVPSRPGQERPVEREQRQAPFTLGAFDLVRRR